VSDAFLKCNRVPKRIAHQYQSVAVRTLMSNWKDLHTSISKLGEIAVLPDNCRRLWLLSVPSVAANCALPNGSSWITPP